MKRLISQTVFKQKNILKMTTHTRMYGNKNKYYI